MTYTKRTFDVFVRGRASTGAHVAQHGASIRRVGAPAADLEAGGAGVPPEAAVATRLACAGTSGYLLHPVVANTAYGSGLACVTLPDGSEYVLDLVAVCGLQAALELARVQIEGGVR